MYCAAVQGELIARQIDSGLSSAMGVKASAVWPQLAMWSLTQYKGATRFCTVLISRAWPSQFSPPCFDNSSALSAALGNLWIASACLFAINFWLIFLCKCFYGGHFFFKRRNVLQHHRWFDGLTYCTAGCWRQNTASSIYLYYMLIDVTARKRN